MSKNQQEQALNTFNRKADQWQQQSQTDQDYSLIKSRNVIVLEELSKYPKGARLLDIGCGTGQLAIEAARLGYMSTGIDYSENMINHCVDNARKAEVKAEFELKSIFDISTADREYDVMSGLGFIEYIPQSMLNKFIARVGEMMPIGGKFLLGTRNRLFNVTSLNQFTEIELELGTFENLLQQAMAFQMEKSDSKDFSFLIPFAGTQPQPDTHPETGVEVATRYQYSPGELYARLRASGFKLNTIYPVHYHAFPPSIKQTHLDEHNRIAYYMQELSKFDLRTLPWCSTAIFSASRKY